MSAALDQRDRRLAYLIPGFRSPEFAPAEPDFVAEARHVIRPDPERTQEIVWFASDDAEFIARVYRAINGDKAAMTDAWKARRYEELVADLIGSSEVLADDDWAAS